MQERRIAAISKAEAWLFNEGHQFGPCIEAKCWATGEEAVWHLEFAHPWLDARSETCDPPSICMYVDLDRDTVRLLDHM